METNLHGSFRRDVLTLAGGAAVAIIQGHSQAYAVARLTAKLTTIVMLGAALAATATINARPLLH